MNGVRDILAAFDRAREADARRIFVMCGRRDSPLYQRSEGAAEASGALFRIPGWKLRLSRYEVTARVVRAS